MIGRCQRLDPGSIPGERILLLCFPIESSTTSGMSASTKFTPLFGEDVREPCCYLLEIDECRILLDCGWDWSAGTSVAAPPATTSAPASTFNAAAIPDIT